MAKSDKPSIPVIWGDDIGISNLSCYSQTFKDFPAIQRPNSFTIDDASDGSIPSRRWTFR